MAFRPGGAGDCVGRPVIAPNCMLENGCDSTFYVLYFTTVKNWKENLYWAHSDLNRKVT